MGDMNVEFWSRLPSEIVERILSFLSVPVLCRFRTVCKSWNSLICNPKFGALCIKHAKQHDACFLVARYIDGEREEGGPLYQPFGKKHGWSFLDLNARRWYTIEQDGEVVFDRFVRGSRVAMDGGLVCQILAVEDPEDSAIDKDVSIIVSNPIAKASRTLPPAPYYPFLTAFSEVDMVVDNIAQNYKVFVMPTLGGFRSADFPLIYVYESGTNHWRNASIPCMPQISEVCIEVECSVYFDGMLYLLMCPGVSHPGQAAEHWLWSYNHVEDTWKDAGVNIHLELDCPQLFVSDNQLFLGAWLARDEGWRQVYEVSQVRLVHRTRSVVFQMTMSGVMQFLDIDKSDGFSLESLHAFGFYKSIVLLYDLNGVSKLYDLSTRSWVLLPPHPLGCLDPDSWYVLRYGKPMHLILPTSTLREHDREASIASV